jgi:hypothetical protein
VLDYRKLQKQIDQISASHLREIYGNDQATSQLLLPTREGYRENSQLLRSDQVPKKKKKGTIAWSQY